MFRERACEYACPCFYWLKLFFGCVLRGDLLCLVGEHASDPLGLHTVKDAMEAPVTVASSHCSSVLVDVLCSILKMITVEL